MRPFLHLRQVEGTEFGQLLVNYGAEDGCDELQPLTQVCTDQQKQFALARGHTPSACPHISLQEQAECCLKFAVLGLARAQAKLRQMPDPINIRHL